MDTFPLVAGWASILGLGFSAWAVWEVRRLRSRYNRMGLLPRWTNALDDHASRLTELLEVKEIDFAGVEDEIARLQATLESHVRLVGRGNKQEVHAVPALIRQKRPLRQRSQIRAIRTGVYGLIRTLRMQLEEDQWT